MCCMLFKRRLKTHPGIKRGQARINSVAHSQPARKSAKVRLDDLTAIAGVCKQFVSGVQFGKPSVQLGLVLNLLSETGLSPVPDISPAVEVAVMASGAEGVGGLAFEEVNGLTPPRQAFNRSSDKALCRYAKRSSKHMGDNGLSPFCSD